MAFKVVVDGKPCSGKTTIARAVSEELSAKGITTIDAKSYALENGFMAGFLKKFTEKEIDSYRSLAYSGTQHLLSYIALEASVLKNNSKCEVIIIQRSPYAFSFVAEAVKSVSGIESEYRQKSLLYGVIKAWAGLRSPDLFIYLSADFETLMDRFKHRKDGRDIVHLKMIEADDSRHIKLLRGYMQDRLRVIENNSSVSEGVECVEAAIMEAYQESKQRSALPIGMGRTERR